MKFVSFTVLLVMIIIPVNSSADELDKPIHQTPTVKSEILRGYEISNKCGLDSATDIISFDRCVRNAEDIQRRISSSSEAFSLGLNFWAMINSQLLHRLSPTAVTRSTVRYYVAAVDEAQKKVRVNDTKLLKLFKLAKAKDIVTEARNLGREPN